MKINTLRRKILVMRLTAAFRFLLWRGARALQSAIFRIEPDAVIESIEMTPSSLPQTRWVQHEENVFCLYGKEAGELVIRPLPGLSEN